jgi:YD repeat-containing protein
MRAELEREDQKTVSFLFMDGANLANSTDGHTRGLTLTFRDEDHIDHKWTWHQNGQKKIVRFELGREN